MLSSGFNTIDALAPLNYVKVYLKGAPLAPCNLGKRSHYALYYLSDIAASGPEKYVFYCLHRYGACATRLHTSIGVLKCCPDCREIDPPMLHKSCIFGRYNGLLNLQRDLIQGEPAPPTKHRFVVQEIFDRSNAYQGCYGRIYKAKHQNGNHPERSSYEKYSLNNANNIVTLRYGL